MNVCRRDLIQAFEGSSRNYESSTDSLLYLVSLIAANEWYSQMLLIAFIKQLHDFVVMSWWSLLNICSTFKNHLKMLEVYKFKKSWL